MDASSSSIASSNLASRQALVICGQKYPALSTSSSSGIRSCRARVSPSVRLFFFILHLLERGPQRGESGACVQRGAVKFALFH